MKPHMANEATKKCFHSFMDIQSAHPSLTPNYVSSRGDGKFSKSVAYKFVLNELLFLFSLRKVTVSV